MDADGWDRSDEPGAMIRAVASRVSPRKWRLFSAAACRDARRQHLLPAVIDSVSLAERYADKMVDEPAMQSAFADVQRGWGDTELPHLLSVEGGEVPVLAAARALWVSIRLGPLDGDSPRRAHWLREVVGNPFRWVRWEDEWATRTAHAIAAPAYAAGRFDTLPVLADALEDAGCDNAELLAHLRGPGPHVRGCWALDVVLGKV